jgi:hypothetical protein
MQHGQFVSPFSTAAGLLQNITDMHLQFVLLLVTNGHEM